MAKNTHITVISFLLLISIFHSYNNWQVSARETHARRSHHHHHHHHQAKKSLPSPVSSYSVSSSCASSPLPQGGLKISHRYGPCSLQGKRQELKQGSHNSLYNTAAADDTTATNYAVDSSDHGEGVAMRTFGRSQGAGNFLVTIGLGTPERDFDLMFDTGSDLSWVKCQPDGGGDGGVFDPSASSTFNVTCDPSCNYRVPYLDRSSSTGYYAKDRLTIAGDELPNFTFGCSQKTSGNFGDAAGVLALGRSNPITLISQTAAMYGQIFCYCLPTFDNSAGYLLFGNGATHQCRSSDNQFTALVGNRDSPNQYFVDFNGITIGSARLDFRASSSSSPSMGTTMMDSGTVITKLPAAVYEFLKGEFVKSVGEFYPRVEKADKLDTCYDMEGNFNAAVIPAVVLHFDGMDLRLGPSAVVWMDDGYGQVCLAFAAKEDEKDSNIIGNHQQRGLNVLYDVENSRVEIGPGSCGGN
ncbi:unnamed protein product [Linum tenue]|uniref:Peptidase A1 domain-containing protein n=1 Tax=Linum tenue TaxID=586396 RepID=A0AAV0GUD4_9ROSI|nr:unnamed protein product [Linum tenue]